MNSCTSVEVKGQSRGLVMVIVDGEMSIVKRSDILVVVQVIVGL